MDSFEERKQPNIEVVKFSEVVVFVKWECECGKENCRVVFAEEKENLLVMCWHCGRIVKLLIEEKKMSF
jgi:hypothetical protein